jgi:glutathione peroxidase-family protein
MDEELLVDFATECGIQAYLEDLQEFAKMIRAYERKNISILIAKMPGDTAASIAVYVREL